jgi:hypothetical protein
MVLYQKRLRHVPGSAFCIRDLLKNAGPASMDVRESALVSAQNKLSFGASTRVVTVP